MSGTITVTASASDNVGVSRVEFYVDSVLRDNDTVAPYAFSWNATNEANATHVITARAYDVAGNANAHSVNVIVDNRRRITDLNNDGKVDINDIIIAIVLWKQPGIADINKDGTTDLIDVGIMLSRWTG